MARDSKENKTPKMNPVTPPATGSVWLRRLSALTYLATLALSAVAFYYAARGGSAPPPPGWGFHGDDAVLAVAFSTVGALITANRPRNKIGWLMLLIALGSAISSVVEEYIVVRRFGGGGVSA